MLGKIFEENGWNGKTIEHSEIFLDSWKVTDLGIAEVKDMKMRLSELKKVLEMCG